MECCKLFEMCIATPGNFLADPVSVGYGEPIGNGKSLKKIKSGSNLIITASVKNQSVIDYVEVQLHQQLEGTNLLISLS